MQIWSTGTNDPFIKREQFAVSLRKKKKAEILAERRKRYINCDLSDLENHDYLENYITTMLPVELKPKNVSWEKKIEFLINYIWTRIVNEVIEVE